MQNLTLCNKLNWKRKYLRDIFLYEINNTRCKGYTFNEFMESKDVLQKAYVRKYLEKYPRQYRSCYTLYFGTVNVFPPSVALTLYKLYSAKAVLDPCAGWGGRMLAADELDICYDGYDTNTNLSLGYSKLKCSKLCNIYLGIDSSKFQFELNKYDFVFTSPPYYTRECYSHQTQWKSKKDFINSFYIPMCRSAWNALKINGYFAINVPTWMYNVLVAEIGDACTKYIMPKSQRSGKPGNYTEYIYVWRKEIWKIRKSPIHGNGLFITTNIEAGTRIVEYTGEEMSKADFKERYGNDIQYVLWNRQNFPNTKVIVSKLCRNPITYCNESKNPNCIIKQRWLTANRTINVGEELTLQYHSTYPRNYTL